MKDDELDSTPPTGDGSYYKYVRWTPDAKVWMEVGNRLLGLSLKKLTIPTARKLKSKIFSEVIFCYVHFIGRYELKRQIEHDSRIL